VADAVWDESRSGHTTAGSFGEAVQTATGQITSATSSTITLPSPYATGKAAGAEIVVDNQRRAVGTHAGSGVYAISPDWTATPANGSDFWLGGLAAVAGAGSLTAADVWTYATRVLTAGTNIALTKGTGLLGLNDIAATAIVSGGAIATSAGAVSTVTTTGTVTDKAGYSLATAPPTAATIADAVWDESRSGHTNAGTFGLYLDTQVSGISVGGGASDWTADEKTAIRAILGIPGSGATPADPTAGILDTIRDAAIDKTGYKLASDGLDSIVVETGVNARQAASITLAAAAGTLSGAGSGASTITVKGGNVATTRIVAAGDEYGNRTSVTLTLPS
jgi:hypothetical protein